MRESKAQRSTVSARDNFKQDEVLDNASRGVYEHKFFESFFRANIREGLDDRSTIGMITELEARFHYNQVENAIIAALVEYEPPPPTQFVEAYRSMRRRQCLRALDIGPGAGHWIDFWRSALLVSEVVGVELTDQATSLLREKYAPVHGITIRQRDIAEPGLTADEVGGAFDYISAIGVMFHIIDDGRWESAVANLAGVLKPGGKLFVNGDFGARTENREAVRSVQFESWKEYNDRSKAGEIAYVTRRVRSLRTWIGVARKYGLEVADVVRTAGNPHISTPDDNVMLLMKPE